MDCIERALQTSIAELDLPTLSRTYHQQDLLVLPNFLPDNFVQSYLLPEVKNCSKLIHRVHVPGFKKSGSVGRSMLKKTAPVLASLYELSVVRQFIEGIVNDVLLPCPSWDQHGVALYYYTEPGDRINVHYDKSFYRGKRFTVLLGMIQDSTHSKLICYPGASKRHRRKNPMEVLTHPGTLVIFNGDTLWHEVTPLGEDEYRAILTLEFLTDQRISFFNKWVTNCKDRFLYFGHPQTQ